MATVRIDTVVLATKEAQVRGLTTNLTLALWQSFNAGPVDEQYQRLHDRWDKAQEELTTGLTTIADILKGLREAFETLDQELASALESDGGNTQ